MLVAGALAILAAASRQSGSKATVRKGRNPLWPVDVLFRVHSSDDLVDYGVARWDTKSFGAAQKTRDLYRQGEKSLGVHVLGEIAISCGSVWWLSTLSDGIDEDGLEEDYIILPDGVFDPLQPGDVRTENDQLIMGHDFFWFKANRKHSDDELESVLFPWDFLDTLARHK
jgi:hypothetical protein